MDCVFCRIVKGEIPAKKIYEDENILAFLDINPSHPGHTLVIPKKHTLDFSTIDKDELIKVLDCAKELAKLISTKLNSDGYSLCQNNGICQEVKHFHLHIIPEYKDEPKLSVDKVYEKITQ